MPEPENERRGIRDAARAAVGSGLEYARARGELFAIEAAEAKGKARTISTLAAIGLALCIAGYTLALALACSWLGATLADGDWRIPAAALAGAHLFAGAVLLVAARSRARKARLFHSSIAQFEQDRKWLQETRQSLKSRR